MLAATFISAATQRIADKDALRIAELILRLGKLPEWSGVSTARILASMQSDKKAHAGKLSLWYLPNASEKWNGAWNSRIH